MDFSKFYQRTKPISTDYKVSCSQKFIGGTLPLQPASSNFNFARITFVFSIIKFPIIHSPLIKFLRIKFAQIKFLISGSLTFGSLISGFLTFGLLTIVFLTVGCKSTQEKQKSPETVNAVSSVANPGQQEISNPTSWKAIVPSGDSHTVNFSKDGKKISYVSSARTAHSNSQAYMLTLATGAEERISYSSGRVTEVVTTEDGHFLISNSEAIKENLFSSEDPTKEKIPTNNDLLLMNDSEEGIYRLTDGSSQNQNLSLGRSNVIWSAGHETQQLFTLNKLEPEALNWLNPSKTLKFKLNPATLQWAWIQNATKNELLFEFYYQRNSKSKPEKIPFAVSNHTLIHWVNLKSFSLIWIHSPNAEGTHSEAVYIPEKKCLLNLKFSKETLPLGKIHELTPSPNASAYIAVAGDNQRQILSASPTWIDNLNQRITKAATEKDCGSKVLEVN